jgi:hypothetical protein
MKEANQVIEHDPEAWQAGFLAGEKGHARCPYPAPSKQAWSWESGRVEGAAKREGYSYTRGVLHDGKP